MPSPVLTLRVPIELLAKIDELRGERTRSAFAIEALEALCHPARIVNGIDRVAGTPLALDAPTGEIVVERYSHDPAPLVVQSARPHTVKRDVTPLWKKGK